MVRKKESFGNPALRGVGSSVVLSIIVVLSMSTVWYTANRIQENREGAGKFDFEENMCFDIDDEKDFYGGFTGYMTGTGVSVGSGGSINFYVPTVSPPNNVWHHAGVNILTTALNDTVNGYGVTTAKVQPGDTVLNSAAVLFCMNFTKTKILDLDLTRIDVYLDIGGVTFTTMELNLLADDGTGIINNLATISLKNITKIKIDVGDLLNINTMGDTDKILLEFRMINPGIIPANTFVIFDMQFYCVEEIKALSLDTLGYIMIVQAFALFGMGVLMLGNVSIWDVWNFLKGGK